MSKQEKIDTSERFKLLHTSLKEISDLFIDNGLKTTAFLVIVMGWLFTSEQTRNYLASNSVVKWISLAVVAFIGVIHVLTCSLLYTRSKKKSLLLSELEYVEPEYYSHYRISLPHFLILVLMNTSLFIVIFAVVYFSGT
jgi:hypothetical protein